MSEAEATTGTDQKPDFQAEELNAFKEKADALGIRYHPSIGLEKLKTKIIEAEAELMKPAPVIPEPEPAPVAKAAPVAKISDAAWRKEQLKLIRLRIVNMNPNKSNWPGEILTCGNSKLGMVKKYIPYGDAGQDYHVPNIIYKMMKDKKCSTFYQHIDRKGQKTRKMKVINEFNLMELPPLTQEELDKLASEQKARHALDD